MHEALIKNKNDEQIMLDDFNLYHTMWGESEASIDERADELIFMAEEFVMEQALPVGTVTYEENCQTTIDLLFATPALTVNIIKCDTENDFESGSNHLSILTKLKLAMIESVSTTRRNFNKLNADTLRETLVRIMTAKECLYTLPENGEDLINECIDYQVAAIIDSI